MIAYRNYIGIFLVFCCLLSTGFYSQELGGSEGFDPDPSETPDQKFVDVLLNDQSLKVHLIDRNQNRPAKCPLRSELKLWDLHKRMRSVSNALKYGECYNKNKDMIDGFESLLSERDSYLEKLQNGPQKTGMVSTAQGVSSGGHPGSVDQKQIFNVLTTVSQDEDCMMNVKKRGLLPVVADIATNAGLMASIMPTPNGFLIGATGVAVGSALKIINGLFQSPFNWKAAEDRKQFLDMNCSFFDLRRDIDAAEITEIQDIHIDQKIKEIKFQQKRVLTLLNENESARKTYLGKLERMKQHWVKNSFGNVRLEFLDHVEKIMPSLEALSLSASGSVVDRNVIRIEAVNLFMERFPKMLALWEKMSELPPYAAYLKEIMSDYRWEKLGFFHELDFSQFEKQYTHPLYYYFNKYRSALIAMRDSEKKKWVAHQNKFTQTMTNDQVTQKILKEYEVIDSRLKGIVGRLDIRI